LYAPDPLEDADQTHRSYPSAFTASEQLVSLTTFGSKSADSLKGEKVMGSQHQPETVVVVINVRIVVVAIRRGGVVLIVVERTAKGRCLRAPAAPARQPDQLMLATRL
jgi:hypothetical protein